MGRPYKGEWVLRSVLFVPGHLEKMLNHAASSDADCVILDLEDAVPQGKKKIARSKIRQVLENNCYSRKTVFVRVSPLRTGLTRNDLEEVACDQLHGFVYPLAESSDEIITLETAMDKKTRFG